MPPPLLKRGLQDLFFPFITEGGFFPLDLREYLLWGHQPPTGNLGHEGAPWGSYEMEQALHTARACYYLLTGEDAPGEIPEGAGGHLHDEGPDTWLAWWQLGTWTHWVRGAGLLGGGVKTNSTSPVLVSLFRVVLPGSAQEVIPHAFVEVPSNSSARIRFAFYAENDLATPVEQVILARKAPLTKTVATEIEGAPISLADIPAAGGARVVYVSIEVSSSSALATCTFSWYRFRLQPFGARTTPQVDFDDTLALSTAPLSAETLATVYLQNAARLWTLIYGTSRSLPAVARGHDHGRRGGEFLARGLGSTAYLHHPEGSGTNGGTAGFPLLPPAAGVDFAQTPKLVLAELSFLPGGVEEVVFEVVAHLPGVGTREVTFQVGLRPVGEWGYGPGAGAGVFAEVTVTATGAAVFVREVVTLETQTFSSPGIDRLVERVVFLTSTPPAGARLLSTALDVGAASPLAVEVGEGPPREEIPAGKIRQGQALTALHTARHSRVYNQLTTATVGAPPGLEPDVETPRTSDPWVRQLYYPHQHQGQDYTDPVTLLRVADGAVIRRAYASQCLGGRFATGTPESTTTMDDAPVQGALLSQGTADLFFAPLTLPAGLETVELFVTVQPQTTAVQTALWAFLELLPVEQWEGNVTSGAVNPRFGPSVIQAARCGPFVASPIVGEKSAQIFGLTLLPEDGVLWQANEDRLRGGLGLWTRDALRRAGDLPAGIDTRSAARTSATIRLDVAPLPRTGLYLLAFRIGLQVGLNSDLNSLASFDTGARLISYLAVPGEER